MLDNPRRLDRRAATYYNFADCITNLFSAEISMTRIVQARLDVETGALVDRLKLMLDTNESEIVREGIRALWEAAPKQGKRRLSGIGKYESGVDDLATNPKFLDDFGR
jgi:DNA invertase Pin-like site-specific DNA recombinase